MYAKSLWQTQACDSVCHHDDSRIRILDKDVLTCMDLGAKHFSYKCKVRNKLATSGSLVHVDPQPKLLYTRLEKAW